jgi:hypothetical protein
MHIDRTRNSDADRDDGSRVVRRRAAEQMEQSTVNTLYVIGNVYILIFILEERLSYFGIERVIS